MTERVAQRIRDLYENQDPQVKAAANAELVAFQDQDAAWQVAHELLGADEPTLQFVGGQMLIHKCRRNAKQVAAELPHTLLSYLRIATLPPVVRARIELAAAALAARLITSSWPSAVQDLAVIADSSLRVALRLLTALAEEALEPAPPQTEELRKNA